MFAGEVKCLQWELEAERSLLKRERQNMAQELLQKEEQHTDTLKVREADHQGEINKLLQDVVGNTMLLNASSQLCGLALGEEQPERGKWQQWSVPGDTVPGQAAEPVARPGRSVETPGLWWDSKCRHGLRVGVRGVQQKVGWSPAKARQQRAGILAASRPPWSRLLTLLPAAGGGTLFLPFCPLAADRGVGADGTGPLFLVLAFAACLVRRARGSGPFLTLQSVCTFSLMKREPSCDNGGCEPTLF